ncbi:CheR family methyltransferase [Planctomicrobium sp. SH661]|uniref:CheR family methyltransferase n=1 Tax=Planctomicrobium sp. SH661 TaxID=3448124 RepID=UPI003F5B1EC7
MPLATANFDYLREVVARRSGNVVSVTQSYLVESRLQPMAESLGLANVEALVAELQRAPASTLHDKVAEAMTINETSFFRDLQPFDALRNDVLPAILARKASERRLNIWSAASSSGQEPYSIAMLLREHFPQCHDWQVQILATDLSDEMLRRTKSGSYSQFEVNRGLPARLLVKYFERQGTQWQAKPELRDWIVCRKLNLTMPFTGMPEFDVVFLRNVLIYFNQAGKESILSRIHRVMSPHGTLFLGGGETMVNLNVPFARESVGQTVCFRPL